MNTPRFSCADVDDLAGLYVLDALDADEARGVREHLETCDRRHDAFATGASATGALAESVEPVVPPAELRARVLAAVAVTPQVPDDVPVVLRPLMVASASVPAAASTPAPTTASVRTPPVDSAPALVSIDAARERRRPSALAWFGLAAAAVIVIAALGAWNVSLQRQVSDSQGQVASLQQALTDTQQQATAAASQVTSLQAQISDTQAQLTAAIDRANTSDAQVASLQQQIQTMQVQVASYQQQIAATDENLTLIGQAIAAATAAGSNVATLASTTPDNSAAGMAIFPSGGTGYIMVEGLPQLGPDQTYQAWYGSGGEMTSAGLVPVGPQGVAIIGGLDPIAGTDTIALTVEPAGGVEQPTGTPIVAGTLPTVVAIGVATLIQ